MSKLIWLRAESKTMEARSALTPADVRMLVEAGFEVMVERSEQRAISDADFGKAGGRLVDNASWPEAPAEAWILGLKELPEDGTPLRHRHIYFAHVYKNQPGWQATLRRFKEGGGQLFDLEYLLDDHGRRVAAFGYWAGFTGCAVGLKVWAGQQLQRQPVMAALHPWSGKDPLLAELREELGGAIDKAGRHPTIIIIGALGRVGEGAIQLARELGLEVSPWDMQETAGGGPFPEILEHDLFINCVLVQHRIPPFITRESLQDRDRRLSVICDVSCDPGEYNPIPLYDEATTFAQPVTTVIDGEHPLHLSAIDHLPSLLPVESSSNFARQLVPHLLTLDDGLGEIWQRALQFFNEKSSDL